MGVHRASVTLEIIAEIISQLQAAHNALVLAGGCSLDKIATAVRRYLPASPPWSWVRGTIIAAASNRNFLSCPPEL